MNVIYNENWTMFTDRISAAINPFCGQSSGGLSVDDHSVRHRLRRLRDRYAPVGLEKPAASRSK